MGTIASAFKYFWHKHPGEESIPVNRYLRAIHGGDVRRKKLAVVGFLARMRVSAQIGRLMIETGSPGDEDAVYEAIHLLFGGEEKFEEKIKHPSWAKAIEQKKVEIEQEIETARKQVWLLRGAVSLVLLVLLVTGAALFSGGKSSADRSMVRAGERREAVSSRPDQSGEIKDRPPRTTDRQGGDRKVERPWLQPTNTLITRTPGRPTPVEPVREEPEPVKKPVVFRTIPDVGAPSEPPAAVIHEKPLEMAAVKLETSHKLNTVDKPPVAVEKTSEPEPAAKLVRQPIEPIEAEKPIEALPVEPEPVTVETGPQSIEPAGNEPSATIVEEAEIKAGKPEPEPIEKSIQPAAEGPDARMTSEPASIEEPVKSVVDPVVAPEAVKVAVDPAPIEITPKPIEAQLESKGTTEPAPVAVDPEPIEKPVERTLVESAPVQAPVGGTIVETADAEKPVEKAVVEPTPVEEPVVEAEKPVVGEPAAVEEPLVEAVKLETPVEKAVIEPAPVEEPVVEAVEMKEPAGNEPAMVEEPVAETVELETSVEKAVIEPTPVEEPVVEVVEMKEPPGNEPAEVEEPVAETVELETSVEKAVIEPAPVEEPVVEAVEAEKLAASEPAAIEEPIIEAVEVKTPVEKAAVEPIPVDEPVVEVVTVEKPLEKVAADPALSKQTDGEVVAPAVVAKPSPTMAETKSARATTVSEPAQPLPALDEGDRYAGVVAESAWRDDAVEIVLMPTIREMELTDERPGGAPVVSPRRVAALKPAEPSSGSPEKKQTTLTGEPASSEGSKAISDHKKSSIQLLLKLAAADIEQRRLTRPRGDNAQEKYQAVLRLDPDNELAKAGLNRIVDRYLEIAREALADGKRFRARQRLLRAESVLPGTERVKRMRESLEAAKKRKILPRIKRPARKPVVDAAPAEQRPAEVEKLLAAAERYTDRNMLTQPPGMNALENYQQVLKLDPGNERALQGMQRLVELYLIIARRAIREGKLLKARNRLWRALHIDPSAREAEKLLTKVEQRLRRN